MAYVLGLIYTDGNLHLRKTRSGYEMGVLSFAQKDKELVEKMLKLMKCDAKIRFRKRRVLENITAGELYYFSIGNNDLANDLRRLGVTPKKSLSMKFPEIPTDYLSHFVHGFFDGDGSVYLANKKFIRITLLSGSYDFIEALNYKLRDAGFPLRRIYGGYKSQKNAHFIRYTSHKQALEFFNFLYRGVSSEMYYERKHQIFLGYFEKKVDQVK
ncbi:MAG: hypothetical protein IIA45_12970 [Bacteroidetes bacterium]|nr:hypothetical protein [Bacteroidota bacterium]